MCSSQRTCDALSEYLATMDRSAPPHERGKKMMERRLRLYLWWKGKLSANAKEGKAPFPMPQPKNDDDRTSAGGGGGGALAQELSEALRRKDAARKEKALSRRRMRGGAAGSAGASQRQVAVPEEAELTGKEREKLGILAGEGEMRTEADNVADL